MQRHQKGFSFRRILICALKTNIHRRIDIGRGDEAFEFFHLRSTCTLLDRIRADQNNALTVTTFNLCDLLRWFALDEL